MSYAKTAHLQALYARRREAEHNRIERTEAVNNYYDHWGKQTIRYENWTKPEYYKQAEQQLQDTKDVKEKQKKLAERQQRLSELLETEKKNYELEMQEKEKSRRTRRYIPTRTLEKMEEHLKEQQKARRKLELEAKLYGKWRHGVDDENLIFESKSDNEVLAKLNWLDKQVDGQLQREKDEQQAKERDLRMQQELNKTEQLQKERQQIREHEIREIRNLQELHMNQLKERQQEADTLKEQEKKRRANLEELNKEFELLQESYDVLKKPIDFGEAYNFRKIKIFIRQRSDVFRNQIKLCMSILERTLDFAENPDVRKLIHKLEKELNTENDTLSQIEGMYESEAKYCLKKCEDTWQNQHYVRYKEIKDVLNSEHQTIKYSLNEIMKRQEELLEIRTTHLSVIENSGERLKLLMQEQENSPRFHNNTNAQSTSLEQQELKKMVTFSPRRQSSEEPVRKPSPSNELPRETYSCFKKNCNESDNNLSPRSYNSNEDIKQSSNSFNNLNLNGWQNPHPSQRNLVSMRKNAQRSSLQVVSAETEANRPRFGRKHSEFNRQGTFSSLHRDESDNNLSPRCYNSKDFNDIDQASNSFNNLNLDGWQDNPHPSQRDRDSMRQNAQRAMQVVTAETEANRPRFGRKNTAWMN